MSFQWNGKRVTLHGMASSVNKLIKDSKMTKVVNKQQGGILLSIFAIHMGVEQPQQEVSNPHLQQLLTEFHVVFEECH